MLHAFAKLCSIGLLAFVAAGAPQAPPAPQAPQAPPAPQVPQAPDEIAFMAALALKQKAEHLPAVMVQAQEAADVAHAIDVVKQLRAINGISLRTTRSCASSALWISRRPRKYGRWRSSKRPSHPWMSRGW